MTAHTHPGPLSRPRAWSAGQQPLVAPGCDGLLVDGLLDAQWRECGPCIETAVAHVAASPSALLALRRVCTLQHSGKVRWPHGSGEADGQIAQLQATDPDLRAKLTAQGARMWAARARAFDEIDAVGERITGI